jgi:hypothetical protein
MGRRTSGQQVGLQAIGNVQANANTLTTTQTNQSLTIDPNGTGTVDVQTSVSIAGDLSITNQGDLRLLEASANGTNYIAQQAAANMAANYTITWPAAVAASAGLVLTSDGSGNLSWASAGGNIAVADPGSTATVHYPLFGTASGSLPTTLSPLARSNLTFVPSTGTLTTTVVSSGTVSATATTASTGTTSGAITSGGGLGVAGRTSTTDLTVTNTPITIQGENVQTVSYTLALTDRNLSVTMNNSSAATVTIPADAAVNFPVGSTLVITRIGSGALTLAATGGVTVSAGGTGNLALGETVSLRKRAANNWIVNQRPYSVTGTGGSLATIGDIRVHSYASGTSTFVVGT